MNKKFDVIVIGAGIIGCAVAFELAKKGYKTLNIDKNPDSGYGSTSNSCGIIRFSYSTLDGVALAYEGYHYWVDWANYLGVEDERGLVKYHQQGNIMLKTKARDSEKILNHYRQIGIRFEEWDVDTLKAQVPIYDTRSFWPTTTVDDPKFWNEPEEEIFGAVFTPDSGYISEPQLATHNIQRAAEAQGGQFLFDGEVAEIRQEEGRVVGVILKDGQQIDAPVVVNVAGPHSFIINRMAGVEKGMRIKTRAQRHEVHHVPSPPGFDFEKDGRITSDGDNSIYFRPEPGNRIAVGSEDPECDPKIWVDDPDNYDRNFIDSQWKAQVYRLAKRIPNLPIPKQPQGVVDLYDVSDDWIPIYDKSDLKGFYMAVGTSGNQFKNAGVVGQLMAELIEACEQGHDHDNDPLQIKGRYTGVTINVGTFSRLREINKNSSFSVLG